MKQSADSNSNLRSLQTKCKERNIPLHASLELTYRCNLKCCHCYIPPECRHNGNEMSFKEVCDILLQLKDEGTLFLNITGGEVFLREDLFGILEYARSNGFVIVRLLTNGTLITSDIAKRIKELDVKNVEASIYGPNQIIHELITGARGSFRSMLDGAEALKAEGVRCHLKMMVLNINAGYIKEVRKLVDQLGVSFSGDYMLSPRRNGSKEPLKYAISEAQRKQYLAEWWLRQGLETISEYHLEKYVPDITQDCPSLGNGDGLCGAGRLLCNVCPDGKLTPCIIIPTVVGDLRKTNFHDSWNSKAMRRFRLEILNNSEQCIQCDVRIFCTKCSGIALLVTGSMSGCPQQTYELAKWRCDELKRHGKI